MNTVLRYAVVLLTALLGLTEVSAEMNPAGNDASVRVLLVRHPSVTPQEVDARVDFLLDTWNQTELNLPTPIANPISLTIANNEDAVVFNVAGQTFTGDADQLIAKLKMFAEQPWTFVVPGAETVREHYAADLVIGLTPTINNPSAIECGRATQQYWINSLFGGNFDPKADGIDDGMDLRGRYEDYLAVVGTTGTCGLQLVTHELGHLFGGGHFDGSINAWLLPSSRAWGIQFTVFSRVVRHVSALARTTSSLCAGVYDACSRLRTYSDAAFGDDNHRNAEALFLTAKSVANYIVGDPLPSTLPTMCSDGIDNDGDNQEDMDDPDCTSPSDDDESGPVPPVPGNCQFDSLPTNVTGRLLEVCLPGTSASYYRLDWKHPCPSSVNKYEVWGSQPDGAPYKFGFESFATFSNLWVIGSNVRVKVRSCGPFSCSGLSQSSFVAVDRC